jgi:ribosomal protein RSM22 (predicted rRNA methylase)
VAAPFDRALRAAIADAVASVPGAELTRAVEALSRRYREGAAVGPMGRLTEAERLAYAAVRLPATAAALDAVFAAVARHTRVDPRTLTDLGAGPGTVLWPARARWPDLSRVTLVDRDPALLQLGMRLWRRASPQAAPAAGTATGPATGPAIDLRTGDLAIGDAPAADLVVLSYAIGELADDRLAQASERALALTSGALVIVEPGTPAGFATIRAVRDRLRAAGATIAAPCPHDDACPMAGNDWCHFAVRLDRSRAHRQSKQAALGWEDEKFAYVVVVPDAALLATRAVARVVRRPRKDTGHVRLALCAPGGLTETIVPRRDARYRAARHAEWGDRWPTTDEMPVEIDPSDT